MQRYLKIENDGQCPSEMFTVLGESLADTCSDPSKQDLLIGRFGSGCKHAIAVLLRQDIKPTVFLSTLRLDFFTESSIIRDELNEKKIERICVKYSGKENGKSKNTTEKLTITTDFGKHIWTETSLALREFVSNAIDFCIRKDGHWDNVKVELVDEGQVRAKAGMTRVFIPINEDVFRFYVDLGKWFLHFSEPESLRETVLLKKGRNFSQSANAVIYRRGVFLREFAPKDGQNVPSLFDYNLKDLPLDEARKASDWDVKYYSTYAFAQCTNPTVQRIFWDNIEGNFWESDFDNYPSYYIESNKEQWTAAYEGLFEDTVLTTPEHAERLKRKGHKTKIVSEKLFALIGKSGVKTHLDVLSQNEKDGIELVEPTNEMVETFDEIWKTLERLNLTLGKTKPPLFSYVGVMDAGSVTWGFFRDNEIYLKSECSGKRLVHVLYEELAHYLTDGATDCSRDFQNFLLDIIVALNEAHAKPTEYYENQPCFI